MGRVTSSSSGGNVRIADSDGNPLTSTGGALDVNVTSTAGITLLEYAQVDSVALGASADILTYTVPIGKTLILNNIMTSSDCIGNIELVIDGVIKGLQRLGYAGSYNAQFELSSFEVAAGLIVLIRGTNMSLNSLATYDATLNGTLI